MASGDVQLGEVGSTGMATAISQGMDVELFWILEDIAAAEALVARNGSGINTIADLKGKKIGTPFVSTSHFQLLYALQQAGLKATDVQVLNMRPPEIAAAWGRGDIDATFIWDPVLSNVKKNGKVLMTSGDICKKGACTFDGLIVTKKFAKENPEFMVALVKALAKADADYRANPKAWTGDPAKVAAVAKWSGAKPGGRRRRDGALRLPEPAGAGLARRGSAAAPTARRPRRWRSRANFLKDQGRLTSVAPDFSKNVTTEWVHEGASSAESGGSQTETAARKCAAAFLSTESAANASRRTAASRPSTVPADARHPPSRRPLRDQDGHGRGALRRQPRRCRTAISSSPSAPRAAARRRCSPASPASSRRPRARSCSTAGP